MVKNDPFERLRDVLRQRAILKTRMTDWRRFLTCRRAAGFSLIDQLEPRSVDPDQLLRETLRAGLRAWHRSADHSARETLLELVWPGEPDHPDRVLAGDLLAAYAFRSRSEPLALTHQPGVFAGPISDPRRRSRLPHIELSGRHDGVVTHAGEPYLLIHRVYRAHEDRTVDLFSDLEALVHLYHVGRALELQPVGVLYNQVVLVADGDRFTRIPRPVAPHAIEDALAELMLAVREFQHAREHNKLYPNRTACRAGHRACPYLPICLADNDPEVIAEQYRVVPR